MRGCECGGVRPTEGALGDGFFYRPTLFSGCDRTMRIVSEEVFGPVATVEVFDTEAEAITLGNDTTYGLAGAVFTTDVERGERSRRRCDTGRYGSTTITRICRRPSGAA